MPCHTFAVVVLAALLLVATPSCASYNTRGATTVAGKSKVGLGRNKGLRRGQTKRGLRRYLKGNKEEEDDAQEDEEKKDKEEKDESEDDANKMDKMEKEDKEESEDDASKDDASKDDASKDDASKDDASKDDASKDDDEDLSCLDDSNVFRSCVNRRRLFEKLLFHGDARKSQEERQRSLRDLKGDEAPGKNPEFIMIETMTFTLGAAIESALSDGCDCRLDVEEELVEYLSRQYDQGRDFSILCAAIVDFGERALGQADGPPVVTDVEVQLSIEIDSDFEDEISTAGCAGADWLRCCIAQDLPADASVDFSCQACPLDQCPETKDRSLQDFLTRRVQDCETQSMEDVVFSQLPLASSEMGAPSSSPLPNEGTASPVEAPTSGPTSGPTPGPTPVPTPGSTPGLPADTTRAPTRAPSAEGTTAPLLEMSMSL